MASISPGTSPSRMGKRRIFQVQDSLSEPPRKSPAGARASADDGRLFDFNVSRVKDGDEARKENQSPPPGFTCDASVDVDKSFKLARPIKRAVRHRSPSPGGTTSQPSVTAKEHVQQNDPVPNYRGLRRNSKDILDEYFGQHSDRRRSSCKDITFQFTRSSESSMDDSNCPAFSQVEVRKRLDTMEEELETPPVSGRPSECFGSVPKGLAPYLDGGLPPLLRSLSVDGYDSKDKRERRDDTQALLFDSTPDLANDERYSRFPSIRNKRRGAVCYDAEPLTHLLNDLRLGEG